MMQRAPAAVPKIADNRSYGNSAGFEVSKNTLAQL
jgi:hypothetical protein